MTNVYEDPESPAEQVTVPEPLGENDALDETALELEPTIVLGRE